MEQFIIVGIRFSLGWIPSGRLEIFKISQTSRIADEIFMLPIILSNKKNLSKALQRAL
jgi:hypothetical protein